MGAANAELDCLQDKGEKQRPQQLMFPEDLLSIGTLLHIFYTFDIHKSLKVSTISSHR